MNVPPGLIKNKIKNKIIKCDHEVKNVAYECDCCFNFFCKECLIRCDVYSRYRMHGGNDCEKRICVDCIKFSKKWFICNKCSWSCCLKHITCDKCTKIHCSGCLIKINWYSHLLHKYQISV